MSFIAPVSTIPVVKAALVAAIAARSEITGDAQPILVSYGVPGKYLPNDIIAVLDATQTFSTAAMIGGGGRHWQDEEFFLEVQIDTFLGVDDSQLVEERALYLASIVVDVIRTDPSIGGLVIEARPVGLKTTSGWEDEHKGRRCNAALTIHVMNQL